MNAFQILNRRESGSVAGASVVVTAAVIAAVVLAFAEDARTPWFNADTHMAAQLVRCEALRVDSRRHQCLSEVAAIADEQARAPVALARSRPPSAVGSR
ncbi:MAG: hypothetical protein ABIR94_23335 [Rubrivivax sp.]